jgi:hypothetical protein
MFSIKEKYSLLIAKKIYRIEFVLKKLYEKNENDREIAEPSLFFSLKKKNPKPKEPLLEINVEKTLIFN